ncbi:MAG: hypothetical protein LC114_16615 [Bryobacterales bacterium]|nr:hypothetical protein [Bryobacterales bacterium]
MSRISFFQRFSQRENHSTNNTLLMLQHIYRTSPLLLQAVLNSLADVELPIGLTFEQQVRRKESVPDGLITQAPLEILVETKTGSSLDQDQVARHTRGFTGGDGQTKGFANRYLFGITKERIAGQERDTLREMAKQGGVVLICLTFSQIAEALKAKCAEYGRELMEIVSDYEAYLSEEGLLEEYGRWLPVFPCGTSIRENVAFGVYYEPASRPTKVHYRFIGLYTQKRVAYVGEVLASLVVEWVEGEAVWKAEKGEASEVNKSKIRALIDATPYYELDGANMRYYLVEAFREAGAEKISPGGIQGMRYLHLPGLIRDFQPPFGQGVDQLAEALRAATWE